VVTNRKYSNVQTMYKAGCRGCDSPEYTPNLCPNCWDIAQNEDITELDAIIDKYKEQMYPELMNVDNVQFDTDQTMEETLKRERDQNDDNSNPPKKLNVIIK